MKSISFSFFIICFILSLSFLLDLNANWDKHSSGVVPRWTIPEGNMSRKPYIGGYQKIDTLMEDAINIRINNILDENGSRISNHENGSDFIQRSIFEGFGPNEYFGTAISMSGDINSDGFNDIVIGATYYNVGNVYIYYGGPFIDNDADVILTGEADSSEFGNNVVLANVNGDSFCDVIVGANHFNSNTGRVYVFLGGVVMDTVADVVMTGEAASDFFGHIASAGDVNNDGYDDLIIGADGNNSNTGKVYIYLGGASMNNVPDVTMDGEGGNHHFGIAVSSAGDVNMDGFDDVIIGAHGVQKAYIYHGGVSMNNAYDLVLSEIAGNYGVVVSYAGDVNGDGFSDVVVGADRYNSDYGRVYVYFGGAAMNATADVIMTGENSNYLFGTYLSTAGDINKDGYSDIIIGAYAQDTGKVYVYFGGLAMNATADIIISSETPGERFASKVTGGNDVTGDDNPDFLVSAFSYNFNTGRVYMFDYSLSGEIISDLILTGESINNSFGSSVSSAGDLNGDGYSDFIVGSPQYNSNKGRAFIYLGGLLLNNVPDITLDAALTDNFFGTSVSSAGDVNNDGYSDAIVGASHHFGSGIGRAYIYFGGMSMDNIADVTLEGEGGHFGVSVSSAGDVNNDNYSDVIVGAYRYNSSTGKAYIYFGGATMNDVADIRMTGEDSYCIFGSSVSSAGDVNNDGFSDVVIGAPHDFDPADTGKVFVFFGGSSMDTSADVIMSGKVIADDFGASVSSAGDINADGYSDIIVGGFPLSSENARAYIYYGGAAMNNTADVIIDEGPIDPFLGVVSSAGDMNGDGYSDVIVGIEHFNSNNGKASIYFGGSPMNNSVDITFSGMSYDSLLGVSVSSAGDINGDGFTDAVIGAPGYNSRTGRAYIILASAINSPANKSFRSRTSGNWNNPLSWQMSTNSGGTWISADCSPDNSSSSISIQNSHIINITFNVNVDELIIQNGGQISIDTLKTLIVNGVGGSGLTLNNGGLIKGKGILLVKGNASLSIHNDTGFTVNCRINSGITNIIENSEFVFHKKLIVDSGAVLNTVFNSSFITIKNDLTNNGIISGNALLRFSDTSLIMGSGSISGPAVNLISGSVLTLGSDYQFTSLLINSGGKFNASTYTLKLSAPGTALVNNGTPINSNCTIEYNGSSPQTLITKNVLYSNLIVNNPAGVSLDSNFSITGLLSILSGDLNLNGKTITLLDTARLHESYGNSITGNSGSIKTSRYINRPDSLNIGGLGVILTSYDYLGLTTVIRSHNVHNVFSGRSSIRRNYAISPENNNSLNAKILFTYDESELDSLSESFLGLYRSTNGGSDFSAEHGNVDTLNNQIKLDFVQSFSLWTAARDSLFSISGSSLPGEIYFKGSIPITWGSLDTLGVKILKSQEPNNDSTKINFYIKNRDTYEIIYDTLLTIPYFYAEDTLVFLRMPLITHPGRHRVIVQPIPDELDPINGYDINSYCFDLVCDAYRYTEPCDSMDGGTGFSGSSGRFAVAFANLNATEIFPIQSIAYSFLDSSIGNAPYKIAIYSDNGSGKPGAAIYTSSLLTSPSGSGTVKRDTLIINPPVNIAPNSRFYVGFIQTSSTNIRVSYQNEVPVRENSFFFGLSDTGNVWYDFAGSSKNFRLDIAPKTNISLWMKAILEGYYDPITNIMIEDTVRIEIHDYNFPYGLIDADTSVLNSSGIGNFYFSNINNFSEYYFVIHHKNHIESWSHSSPEKFNVCDKQYNFSDSITKAYGDNLKLVDTSPVSFASLSGDVNQDGVVEASDNLAIDNDAAIFSAGYLATDLNGDEVIDASDASLAENNAANFVSAVVP
ncbi:MAG: hypothetical protein HGGPFJEG_01168 [Ignavibacteria bacterium]|nr:hypothetical protein [Ignavibacteria bacterium]